MIHDVEFDDSPLEPGESRHMTVRGTHPFFVEIKCFSDDPPPPGYKACPECGTTRGNTGVPMKIVANRKLFKGGGTLDVTITDTEGHKRHFAINVIGSSRSTPAVAGT